MEFVQGFVVSFREGLEAFLIIAILLAFLNKSNNKNLKVHVWQGLFVGVFLSVLLGFILFGISSLFGGTGSTAKLWESVASLFAVLLITTFIVWMIRHGSRMKEHVENKAMLQLSSWGIFFLALVMVLREGAEIVIFSFAGDYGVVPIILGLLLSVVIVLLVSFSIVKIKLSTIFNITLAYLILQAGFLAGYSVHEGLSAAKSLELLSAENPIYTKAFDVSKTVLNHKEGVVGIPLYVAIGWYSKPEIIQFFIQYGLTMLLFLYWYLHAKRKRLL